MGNDFHGGPEKGSNELTGLINCKGTVQVNKSIGGSMHKKDDRDCSPEGPFYPDALKQSLNSTGFIESGIHRLPVLRIADKIINSFSDLICVIETVPELSLKYLLSGVLDRWAAEFNSGLGRDIAIIKNSGYDDTEKLSALIFLLDPARPCRVEKCTISPYNFGPYTVSSPEDILELLRNEPEQMADMLFVVPAYLRPDFYPWIDIHYMKLSFLLSGLKHRINSGIVTDLIPELNLIYITLSGDSIRPFKNSMFTVADPDDILNVPEHERYMVICELEKKNSILYLWLFSVKRFLPLKSKWESMDKTWGNLVTLLGPVLSCQKIPGTRKA
jgi:hypothetical protein